MELNRNVKFIETDGELLRACGRLSQGRNKVGGTSTESNGNSVKGHTGVQNSLVLGVDIETTQKFGGTYPNEGLDPYVSNIVMVQFGTLEVQYIVDARKILDWQPFIELMEDKTIKKVGHNLKFEYKFFKHHLNCIMENYHDTMIVDQILFCGKRDYRYSLKEVCIRRLNYDPDKTVRSSFLKIKNRPFRKEEIEYGADDIILPLLLKKQQDVELYQQQLYPCVRLEMKFLAVLGDMELNGMTFSIDKWTALYYENEKKRDIYKQELDEYVLKHEGVDSPFVLAQYDLFVDSTNPLTVNINWSSPNQVVKYFKHLGICPVAKSKYTGKVTYTVDATALSLAIPSFHDEEHKYLAQLYLEFKANEKNCTTYGKDFLKNVNPITGKIHSNYRQILNTGRISSSQPNLQNIPAGEHRTAFVAPVDGSIINADYSGQENIVLANKSMEPNLLKFYESGETDFHSYVARLLWPKELGKLSLSEVKKKHPELRQRAKAAGFAIAYGGDGYTIAKNLNLPQSVGDEVYKAYFKAFPYLKDYFKSVHKQALSDKYILIDKVTNRRSYLHVKDWGDAKQVSKAKRDAQNFSIQGEAASITKLAAILFRKKIKESPYDIQDKVLITNIVHDEINVEVYLSNFIRIEYVSKLLEEAMEEAGSIWCKVVPLKAEAATAEYWTH